MDSKGTQPYIYIHPFFSKLPSHPGCHITPSRVPCALQQGFVGYPFKTYQCFEEINKMAPLRLSQPTLTRPLIPHSVNNDFAWLCNSSDHLQHWACALRGTRLATGYFCSVRIYELHPEQPCRAVCIYVMLTYVCCYSCCTSQERTHVSAVPMAPWIFFQPLSLHLAYHGFSEQCAQWDTVRQLALWTGSARHPRRPIWVAT